MMFNTKETGPSLILTFGMEPKDYRCQSNPFSNGYTMETSYRSSGSSRSSSDAGSTSQLDWGGVIEVVFKEEIGNAVRRQYERELAFGTSEFVWYSHLYKHVGLTM
jgi:hypothetical protein